METMKIANRQTGMWLECGIWGDYAVMILLLWVLSAVLRVTEKL